MAARIIPLPLSKIKLFQPARVGVTLNTRANSRCAQLLWPCLLLVLIGCTASDQAPTTPVKESAESDDTFRVSPALAQATAPRTPSTTNSASPSAPADEKVTISGFIVDVGDTTPEGLSDAPRTFSYTVREENGNLVQVTYTSFPIGPKSTESTSYRLDFHQGSIQQSDYLIARGAYNVASSSLVVATEGDFIETYSQKR